VQTTHVGLEEAVRAVCQRQLWSDADVEAWESAVVLRGKVVSGYTNVNLAEMVNATDSLTTATDKLLASSFDSPTAAHVSSCNQLQWESSAGHRHLEVVRG
jgi:hypothetical protein